MRRNHQPFSGDDELGLERLYFRPESVVGRFESSELAQHFCRFSSLLQRLLKNLQQKSVHHMILSSRIPRLEIKIVIKSTSLITRGFDPH